ncbi:putative membrane protein [Haloactinospora alba]|uniref:Putative membrane protein n=1 Tax=Haloactinospora alba TaxID=405555 RepID=A0A543NKJ7_9ACTN|nr:SHOCT domain-containing protein [Haloactinospora alba]TQN32393.1 putative membrane protein [Haloactinospora alba]
MGLPLLFSAVVVAVVLAVCVVSLSYAYRPGQASRPREQPAPDPAYAELRRRYAAGEISREEFLQRKIDLEE